jgi:hypothetical protein
MSHTPHHSTGAPATPRHRRTRGRTLRTLAAALALTATAAAAGALVLEASEPSSTVVVAGIRF